MRRRPLFLTAAAMVLTVLAMYVAFTFLQAQNVDPELTQAPNDSKSKQRLVVGKNVHVSAARSGVVHQGCTIAADSKIPLRLFAASMAMPKSEIAGIAGYFSHDGGETWALGVERTGPTRVTGCSDEAMAFNAEGDLFLAYMRGREIKNGQVIADTELLRSGDGGKSWEDRAVIKGGLVDRPQLVADLTSGPFRGRLYCSANVLFEGSNIAAVFASADGGKNMTQAQAPSPAGPTVYNSNPVVLADGTVMVAYHKIGENASQAARFPVWRSTDGGKSFKLVSPVRTAWRHPKLRASNGTTMYPRLAGDSASSVMPGRLYCTWRDGEFVLFSWSADRGDTWSEPVLLSEQSLQGAANGSYHAEMPAIAVNKAGHTAVLWYDRRGLPPAVAAPDGVKMDGYNLRLRASTDGGLTWLPSIQVNEAPGKGNVGLVRAWIGMAASADGRFHPAWISDSSGTLQVWTATVSLSDVK